MTIVDNPDAAIGYDEILNTGGADRFACFGQDEATPWTSGQRRPYRAARADGLPGRGVTFGTLVRIVVAGLIGIVVFVVSSVILLLAGAFTFRMLLGVSTYRSSGTYIGVWVFGIAGGLALSVASAWQFLRSGDR